MKDSKIDWIGEIPDDWDVDLSKHIFVQRNTKGNSTEVQLAATQKYGMYPQNLLEGVVLVKEDTDLQKFKTVHKNDYVISLRSFQGGFEMSDFEGVCSPAYQVFFNKKNINHRFYKYFFKSDGFISKMNSLTVGIREGKNILYKDFANSLIIVPPKLEQEKIANYLDKKLVEIDTIIEESKKTIDEYKEWKKSIIFETVTGKNLDCEKKDSGIEWIGDIPTKWNLIKLKYVSDIIMGQSPDSNAIKTDGNILFMQGNKEFGIKYPTPKIYCDECPKLSRIGDILLSVRAPVGAINYSDRIYGIGRGLCSIKPISINKDFLKYFFMKSKEDFKYYSNGSTFDAITVNVLLNIVLPLPEFKEQEQIVSLLDNKCSQIDSLISEKEQLIKDLEDYKKSLIYDVVTGKKRV